MRHYPRSRNRSQSRSRSQNPGTRKGIRSPPKKTRDMFIRTVSKIKHKYNEASVFVEPRFNKKLLVDIKTAMQRR